MLVFLYGNKAIKEDINSVNLGSVYETLVALQLQCNTEHLYYYDNKKHGEVDFLIDDYNNLAVLPIEVKSGKDYTRHTSLSRFISTPDYGINSAIVLYNGQEIINKNGIIYLHIYFVTYIGASE